MTYGEQSKQAAIRVSATGVLHQRSRFGDVASYPPVEDQYLYGPLAGEISERSKRRADAEWNAMDAQGNLPDGWENPYD